MAEDTRLSAVEYIDRFFDEIRTEVRSNPRLASRLVQALGGQVVFESETRGEVASPFVLATGPKARFYAVFSAMKPNDLRRVLQNNNLATSVDMKNKTPEQLVDMLFDRASAKVNERKSSLF
jgi:hypothetical protein